MHMTKQSKDYFILEPQFSYTKKKSLDQQTAHATSKKTVLKVKQEPTVAQFYTSAKQSKQISETVKNQIKLLINNYPKLDKQEHIPYQDVVFKNLQKIFDDNRRSLPGSFIKTCKQPKEKASHKERHRVSISVMMAQNSNTFDVQEQSYHNSDKNFQYDMKIVIKKIPNQPHSRQHPLQKYLCGRFGEYEL